MRLGQLVVLGVGLTGCGSWPRWANLDDTSIPVEEAGAVEWPAAEAEVEPNDGVDGAAALTLGVGDVWLGSGVLSGLGWCSAEEHPDECATPTAACGGPLGWTGRYAYDVDLYTVDVPDDGGHLCARAMTEGEAGLFDVLLLPMAEDCPQEAVLSGEEALGWSLGPEADGWGSPVTAGRWLVLVAGSLRTDGADAGADVPYTLGLSVVPGDPAGGLVRCPALPGEAGGTP